MAAAQMAVAQTAQVGFMTATLSSTYTIDSTVASATIQAALEMMSNEILGKLQWLWQNWYEAMRQQTKQLVGGYTDASRQLLSNNDGGNLGDVARKEQLVQAIAKKNFQPTNQACQFDTAARYLAHTREVSAGAATGYSLDFGKIGNNQRGAPAESGQGQLQKTRWEIYRSRFCDNQANSGNAGCTAALPAANMHILPSKTIFAKETIDMQVADTREAVNQLLYNITGYQAPELVSAGALTSESSVGLEKRQTNREYAAQMDAVGALAYSVVADRISGRPAPEIQRMREKFGVIDASDRPSSREIRQAVVEQLWDPNYYKELSDSPATITQKEVYLKAYGLVMMNDIITKQEKISNIYAIETANMLEQLDRSRSAVAPAMPLK